MKFARFREMLPQYSLIYFFPPGFGAILKLGSSHVGKNNGTVVLLQKNALLVTIRC